MSGGGRCGHSSRFWFLSERRNKVVPEVWERADGRGRDQAAGGTTVLEKCLAPRSWGPVCKARAVGMAVSVQPRLLPGFPGQGLTGLGRGVCWAAPSSGRSLTHSLGRGSGLTSCGQGQGSVLVFLLPKATPSPEKRREVAPTCPRQEQSRAWHSALRTDVLSWLLVRSTSRVQPTPKGRGHPPAQGGSWVPGVRLSHSFSA